MKFSFVGAAAAVALALSLYQAAQAGETTVTINAISETGIGKPLGTVTFNDTAAGLTIRTNIKGLKPGAHGFHIHMNANCGPGQQDGKPLAGLAAGGHFDPTDSKAHRGPHGDGHAGDLPALQVDANGAAAVVMAAPRLKVADLKGRALVIHAGGDNYADQPAALGGGGARVACGVFNVK